MSDTAAVRLPIPERTGDCSYCGYPRRLWRVDGLLVCSGCLRQAIKEASDAD